MISTTTPLLNIQYRSCVPNSSYFLSRRSFSNTLGLKEENKQESTNEINNEQKEEKITPVPAPKFAVLLNGMGYLDGSDVIESVSALEVLGFYKIKPDIFSPDMEIDLSYNYNTKEVDPREERFTMKESQRMVFGSPVKEISNLAAKDYDALLIVGGFGTVRNFSNFATEPETKEQKIDKEFEELITDFYNEKKFIITSGYGGVLPAAILGTMRGGPGARIALGKEPDMNDIVPNYGSTVAKETNPDFVMYDEKCKLLSAAVSGAGYQTSPMQTYVGIARLIQTCLDKFDPEYREYLRKLYEREEKQKQKAQEALKKAEEQNSEEQQHQQDTENKQ